MFCLGAAATIFAPGNMNRMGHESTTFSWGFLGNYVNYKYQLIIMIVSMITIFILKEKELVKKELLYFVLPAIIATLPMAVISYFPPRAFLPYEILFVMIISCNIPIIAKKFEKYYGVIAVVSIALTLIIFRRYSPSTLAQIRYILPYKYALTQRLEEAAERGDKQALVPEFKYMEWIHREDFINIDNFFVEWNSDMPINRMTAMYYGFDKVTAIGEDEYLIQLKVDTEGIKYKNFYGTYLVGPFLIVNPLFTKYLLKKLGVENPVLAHEDVIMDAYQQRMKEFMDPKVEF